MAHPPLHSHTTDTAITCRLGTILLERGQYMEAAELVAKAEGRFRDALQPDNPVRGEAAFALALARIFQLLPFQVCEAFFVRHMSRQSGT